MNARTIEALADRLIAAEATRTPIEIPSAEHPGMTAQDGYRIQRTIVAKKVARGARVVGKKLAFTSPTNQARFGVYEPGYGQLLSSGVYAENTPIATGRLIQPLAECEIAFLIRRRIAGPGVRVADVLGATDGIMPSLEIADSRMRNWIGRATGPDILADSCGNAGFIVGGKLHSLAGFDLRSTGVVAEKNGDVIATAATGAIMGNPAQAVAWLVNKLAEADLALEEGDVVLAAAAIGAVPMAAGDVLTATFGSGLGSVEVRFV
jgi:2-keto-4-pentenoate hydratase